MTIATQTQVPLALRAKAELELRKRLARKTWPAEYANRVTGKVYHPVHLQPAPFQNKYFTCNLSHP